MASIRVVCRFRPQNKIELGQGGKSIITINSEEGSVKIKVCWYEMRKKTSDICIQGSESDHTFNFDRVFPPDVTQKEVYDDGAKPVIEDVLSGYNGMLSFYFLNMLLIVSA